MTSPWTCFTVSGEIGSGKSSVARLLAERTGAEFHSTGGMQRRLARGRNLSTLEMNLLSESEPTIDRQIDGYTKELAASGREVVIDSRLAWHFVPHALKVFLRVDTREAASRVLGDQPQRSDTESYSGREDAVRDILARQESERRRFQTTYGVDLFRWSNYDLVIETTAIPADRAVALILAHRPEEPASTRFWVAPRSLYPTRSFELGADVEGDALLESVRERGVDEASPLHIVAGSDRALYLLDGHRRLSSALRVGLDLVPCRLAGQDDDEIGPGLTVAKLLASRVSRAAIRAWERDHDFRFTAYPEVLRA